MPVPQDAGCQQTICWPSPASLSGLQETLINKKADWLANLEVRLFCGLYIVCREIWGWEDCTDAPAHRVRISLQIATAGIYRMCTPEGSSARSAYGWSLYLCLPQLEGVHR